MRKDTYAAQIKAYYSRTLPSYKLISLGGTPKILKACGAPDLPIVMQQSTLAKCIRQTTGSRSAHNLPRNVIETLPEQIENPIFLIRDAGRNSFALITDAVDREGRQILIALRLDTRQNSVSVNEIKSVYGRSNLKEYLQRCAQENRLIITDIEKADKLSRVIGLQLPKALTAFSYKHNLSHQQQSVKPQNERRSVISDLHNKQKQLAQTNAGVGDRQERKKERRDER